MVLYLGYKQQGNQKHACSWLRSASQHKCAVLCCCAALCWLQEVNDIRAGMEKAKNDIIKSTIAIMGTFSAIAFTITRLMATM